MKSNPNDMRNQVINLNQNLRPSNLVIKSPIPCWTRITDSALSLQIMTEKLDSWAWTLARRK